MKIINKTYNLSSNLNKSIVLISDIHYENKSDIKHLNKILDNIRKIKPNYICIPGDIIDKADVRNFNQFIIWLEKLTTITKVIVALGNHEFYKNKYKRIFELNKENINKIKNINNLYLLDNSNLIIDNINFMGLTLPIDHYMEKSENKEDFKKYIKNIKVKDNYYNILLCHTPINIVKEDIIKGIDVNLILCGHMHGGIVPNFLRKVFGHSGIISPSKHLFPSNVYGHIKMNDKDIIITSGIKMLPNRLKLFNNLLYSEIVIIKF